MLCYPCEPLPYRRRSSACFDTPMDESEPFPVLPRQCSFCSARSPKPSAGNGSVDPSSAVSAPGPSTSAAAAETPTNRLPGPSPSDRRKFSPSPSSATPDVLWLPTRRACLRPGMPCVPFERKPAVNGGHFQISGPDRSLFCSLTASRSETSGVLTGAARRR